MSAATSWVRAAPTMLRVGMSHSLAYRAEFIVWVLTMTLPLVMLGLWTSVASEGPFGSFQSEHFVAYYLGTVIVRNLTGNWVMWQINDDVRRGTLSLRLLRPIHPFFAYATTHLASIPLRAIVAIPFAIILLLSTSRGLLTTDPAIIALLFPSLVGAWALTFFILALIGTLVMFIEKSLALFNVYLGVFAVLSGYLIPLSLLPDWAQTAASMTPFRYMLSFPVETLLGFHSREEVLSLLGIQWAFVAVTAAVSLLVWKAGVRRFEAYGS